MSFCMKPEGSSTPTIVPCIQPRQPICRNYNILSPIMNEVNNTRKDERSDEDISSDEEFEEHSSSSDNDEDKDESSKHVLDSVKKSYSRDIRTSQTSPKLSNISNSTTKKHITASGKIFHPRDTVVPQISSKTNSILNIQHLLLLLVVCLFAIFIYRQPKKDINTDTVDINKLKNLFSQDEKFWLSIKSGILEVKKFEKPSVIILMHKYNMHISELLNNITMYASCILSEDCLMKPIVLKGEELNTYELITDYGILMDRYKDLLEERHVMVVKNLDEIVGPVAQAFHYFCDEYTPLVKKSLILFTVGVNRYEGKPLQQVVNILKKKWMDIGADKLEALITRVSSMVLRIK